VKRRKENYTKGFEVLGMAKPKDTQSPIKENKL